MLKLDKYIEIKTTGSVKRNNNVFQVNRYMLNSGEQVKTCFTWQIIVAAKAVQHFERINQLCGK